MNRDELQRFGPHLWVLLVHELYLCKFANFGPNLFKRLSRAPDLEKIHNFPLLATAIGQTWPDLHFGPLAILLRHYSVNPLTLAFGHFN